MANSSTSGFTALPVELLLAIASQVRKRKDLVSLSLVSKATHEVLRAYLWKSLIVDIWEDDLDYFPPFPSFAGKPLDNTTEVHFSSEFVTKLDERCPHYDPDTEDVDDIDYDYYKVFVGGAISVLNQLQDRTLRSLSWNTGTCLPVRIFGPGGIIDTKQPQIESLSLITDCTCSASELDSADGLSGLTKLKRLCWRAPGCDFVDNLRDMIKTNAENLEYIELDLVNWGRFKQSIGFWQWIFPLVAYPALQTLCLTEVALSKKTIRALDFGTLRTLKLRNCKGWDILLEKAVQLRRPVRLRTLEILEGSGMDSFDSLYTISRFLDTFDGLEELYVSVAGPEDVADLWDGVIAHRATLKRFVHHQRIIETDFDSEHFEKEFDLMDLGCRYPSDVDRWKDIDKLQLEAIGLSALPEFLMPIVFPMKDACLKFIHMRQSRIDLSITESLFFESFADQEGSTDDEGRSDEWVSRGYRLAPSVQALAQWAFGESGIPSLQVIACGDFAYGGRPGPGGHAGVFLCRNEDGAGKGFRVLDSLDESLRDERMEIIDAYRDLLEACPVEPIMIFGP